METPPRPLAAAKACRRDKSSAMEASDEPGRRASRVSGFGSRRSLSFSGNGLLAQVGGAASWKVVWIVLCAEWHSLATYYLLELCERERRR